MKGLDQYNYGLEKLQEISEKYGVSEDVAAKILMDIGYLKTHFDWVNLWDFLFEWQHNNEKQLDKNQVV